MRNIQLNEMHIKEAPEFIVKGQEFTNGDDVIKVLRIFATDKSDDIIYMVNGETFRTDIALFCKFLDINNYEVMERTPMKETIEIKEECKIPGTDFVLEKGDMIKVVSNMNEQSAFDTYIKDVHNIKEYQAYLKEFSKLGYGKLYTLKNGSDHEVNIQPNLFAKNDFHPEIYYSVYKNTVAIQTSAYGSMDLDKHQIFIDHVNDGHKAAELLIKLINDKNYWNAIPDISTYEEKKESLSESKSFSELNKLASSLRDYFKKNNEYYMVYTDKDEDAVCVDVERGDWKHDHLRVDYLVGKYFDSIDVDYMKSEKTTDEDGSDTYSSIHIYHIM